MGQVQMESSLKSVLMVSVVLSVISTFAFIVFGLSSLQTNQKILELNLFLDAAKESQPNFEKSLEMYTDTTKGIIDHLVALRPKTEEELLKVITQIEETGSSLGLNIDLRSTSLMNTVISKEEEKSLDYNISFYGTSQNLKNFLTELESLPYFIKIDSIEYKDPQDLTVEELERKPNIIIKIKLYIT
jgi:Tfp pilus assembly protein PilO